MMRRAITAGALALCGGLAALPVAAQSLDFVRFLKPLPSLAIPGKPVEGEPPEQPPMAVYKPAGPGPFPAVVVQHTCAGVQDHIGHWTSSLLKAGYVVLVLDSFTPRGVQDNCQPPFRVGFANTALDAFQALEHLAAQRYVDAKRVGALGFSWGAMAGLLVARKDIAERLPRSRKDLRFRAVAAVYPHCFLPAEVVPGRIGDLEWLGQDTDTPLLVLMGEIDEETPPKFCLPRLQALKARGAKVAWEVYRDATHGWDIKGASGHRVPTFFGAVHVYQYNAEVSAASRRRVLEFFGSEMN